MARRRKPDPNQGELSFPGFNTAGSESAASRQSPGSPTAPQGAAGGSGGTTPRTDAGEAYRAAEGALAGPTRVRRDPAPNITPGGPLRGGWTAPAAGPSTPYSGAGGMRGAASNALGRMSNGMGPVAALAGGPAAAAVDLGLRGLKSAVKENPYGNLDTKRARASSGEGQSLWMGRGNDHQGLYAQQTSKKYASADGRGRPQHGGVGMFPDEIKETYEQPPGSMAGYRGGPNGMAPMGQSPFSQGAPGLSAPGPASDYMHQSRTSGTNTPWFDAHTAATSGLNTAPVAPIRSTPTE